MYRENSVYTSLVDLIRRLVNICYIYKTGSYVKMFEFSDSRFG